MDHGEIPFLGEAVGKLHRQASSNLPRLGEHDDTACFPIQAMHDARVAGGVAPFVAVVIAQAVQKVLVDVPTRGLDRQIARLVDDDQLVVFVQNCEGDRGVVEGLLVLLRQLEGDDVAGTNPVGFLDVLAVDRDGA